mmetsp:Transcript_50509/g.83708  ORF Transcript_50509/g.83708 Transcript_50509/m.83708 type:complete len:744 (-) Transcript_50509:304-2535(-)
MHAASVFKLQGGTGKHIDGDVAEPLQCRPFQAFVQLTSGSPEANDGSLHVLPGFHGTALHYFQLADLPPPAGGFTPLTRDHHQDLCSPDLWVPVRRMSDRWKRLHAANRLPPPNAASRGRGRSGVIKSLRQLARELNDVVSDPPGSGDYVIWDPRLPHTTGEPNAFSTHNAPRQVFYCAFMLAQEAAVLSAEQRACRQSGLHMSWSPSSHRHDEVTSGYRTAPLTQLGEALYGYNDASWGAASRREGRAERRRDESSARMQAEANEAGCGKAIETAEEVAVAATGGAGSCGLTDAHICFFRRYGFVVVEGAVAADLVQRIASEVTVHLRDRHGLDLADLRGCLTLPKLQRAFSPDGSGMLELYWLPAMEETRQTPSLFQITHQLYSKTWAQGAHGFRVRHAPQQPRLGVYVDRTSIRLPCASLVPLLEGVRCTIKVPINVIDNSDVYIVERLIATRLRRGQRQFLVRWQDYSSQYDTWEDDSNILDRSLIKLFHVGNADELKGNAKSAKHDVDDNTNVNADANGCADSEDDADSDCKAGADTGIEAMQTEGNVASNSNSAALMGKRVDGECGIASGSTWEEAADSVVAPKRSKLQGWSDSSAAKCLAAVRPSSVCNLQHETPVEMMDGTSDRPLHAASTAPAEWTTAQTSGLELSACAYAEVPGSQIGNTFQPQRLPAAVSAPTYALSYAPHLPLAPHAASYECNSSSPSSACSSDVTRPLCVHATCVHATQAMYNPWLEWHA